MNDPYESRESGMLRRFVVGLAAVAGVILAVYFLSSNRVPGPAPKAGAGTTAASSVTDRECEKRLEQALVGLHPERVVVSSGRLDRVAELTQWSSECADAEIASKLAYHAAPNERWLVGNMLGETQSKIYSQQDAQHITICRLFGQLAENITKKTVEPREQAVAAFDFIVRQTQVEPDEAARMRPRTILEAMFVGRATAGDRAWALAVLVRQFHLDAVIIEPKSKPQAWLIGVIRADGDVWLFDPRLGTAIPAAGDDGKGLVVTLPATLAEVRADDSLLRKLDLEGTAYSLEATDLAAVNVRMIGDSSTFSERMARGTS